MLCWDCKNKSLIKKTGKPNVDWCEDHKEEVIRVNVIGTLNLFDLCSRMNIHLTYFGTGCLYEVNQT